MRRTLARWLASTDRFWEYLLGRADVRPRLPLGVTRLEDRLVPDGRPLPFPVIAVGAGAGGDRTARLLDAETGAELLRVTPFEPAFTGEVRVAVADVTRDTYPDLIAAAGPGGGPRVRTFDGKTGEQVPGPIGDFYAYHPSFLGGVNVAATTFDGDLTGNGWADVVTVADAGGGPHVRVFDGGTGAAERNFLAFEEEFRGGLHAAVGDLTGDGKPELVLAAGAGGGPRVRVLDPRSLLPVGPFGDFFAFGEADRGGVTVAAGDVTGDGRPDLVVGQASGPDPLVRVYDPTAGVVAWEASPFPAGTSGGARVAVAFADDDPFGDVVVGTSPDADPRVRTLDGETGQPLAGPVGDFDPGTGGVGGGVNVAAGNDPHSEGELLRPEHAFPPVSPSPLYQGASGTVSVDIFGSLHPEAPTPTGTVTFTIMSPTLSPSLALPPATLQPSAPPNRATASAQFSTAGLPPGLYNVSTVYSGDSQWYGFTAYTQFEVSPPSPPPPPPPTASIGDWVWRDANGNGAQDWGEGTGVEGVVVRLVGNSVDRTVTTNLYGLYRFTDVPPGSGYRLQLVSVPGGYTLSPANSPGVSDTFDSDFYGPEMWTDPFTVASGVDDTTFDAGLVPPPLPVVSVQAVDADASEPGTTDAHKGKFRFTRSSSAGSLTASFTVGGTAAAGADYQSLGTTSVTFQPGEAQKDVTLTPVNDATPEPAETVTVTLAASPNDYATGASPATVTITDDDPRAKVWVTATDPAAAERGLDPGTFVVSRDVAGYPMTVTYGVGGDATPEGQPGVDYAGLRPQGAYAVEFAVGELEKALTVTPTDDTLVEDPETVVLSLQAPAGAPYDLHPDKAHATVTIADADTLVVVRDAATTDAGTPVTISVLSNDTNAEQVTAVTAPVMGLGTVTHTSQGVTFTPAGEAGKDWFYYTALGPNGATGQAKVEVVIHKVTPARYVPYQAECPVCVQPGTNFPGSTLLDAAGTLLDMAGTLAGALSAFSGNPVRYADGTAVVATTDLVSSALGEPWGVTRSWTNHGGYDDPTGQFGAFQVVTQLPRLVPTAGGGYAVVLNGTRAYEFAPTAAGFESVGFRPETLAAAGGQFVVTDATGRRLTFHGFGGGLPARMEGRLDTVADPGGVQTAVAYAADGRLASMTRSGAVHGVAAAERLTFTHAGAPARVSQVVLERQAGGGAWQHAGRVTYAYYGEDDPNGMPGDLRLAVVTDAAGAVASRKYYRYYQHWDPDGYAHGLKFVVEGDAYDRLVAAAGAPEAASDATVSRYATHYFRYDHRLQVVAEVAAGAGCSACAGGQGAFGFAYTTSTHPDGFNAWRTRTIEELPDGNQNVVYTNAYGQVMLRVFREFAGVIATGREWATYARYDAEGRVVLVAHPSAVSGYDDQYADLVHVVGGNAEFLRDGEGLVEAYAYHAATTATEAAAGGAAGYLASAAVRRGEFGAPVPQSARAYYARSAGGVTVYPLAAETAYRNPDGTGPLTTTYAYAWADGTVAATTVTRALPAVSAAEHGPGAAAESAVALDAVGRPVWERDPAGVLTYTEYDPATGAVVKVVEDADTARTGEFAVPPPAGWASPAGPRLHRVTTAEVDAEGRVTKRTNPGGQVDYTIYRDGGREVRTYAGWNPLASAPVGPTLVTRRDATGQYVETLAMTAAPAVSGGRPTGAEAVAGVQSLSRTYLNAAGQAVARRDYFNLAGVAYSAATPVLGTPGVHFLLTEQGYDKRGRANRAVAPDGVVTRTEYDGLGRVAGTWVGTDDVPDLGFWSAGNLGGTDMQPVAAYAYDGGGVGDGHLTRVTRSPGPAASDRVTEYGYDWRGRPVAVKEGVAVGAAEAAAVNRPLWYAEYDNLGRAVRVRAYDGDGVWVADANADGVPDAPAAGLLRGQTEFGYDALGRVYETRAYGVDQAAGTAATTPLTTGVWYDLRGLPVKTARPGGLVEKVRYDAAGRAVAAYQTDGGADAGWADALTVDGDTVLAQAEATYDAAGNLVRVVTRERAHGAAGTGPLGGGVAARTAYADYYYDQYDFGRLLAAVDVGTNGGAPWARPPAVPARSDAVHVTEYGYDAAGRTATVTGPDGAVFRTDYDALGRVAAETTAHGTADAFATAYGYDAGGRLVTVTNPGGRTTRYGYDALGRVAAATERDGTAVARTIRYEYNRLGEVTAVLGPPPGAGQAGAVTLTAYDAVGRVVRVTAGSGSAAEQTTAAAYDALGRVVSVTDPRGHATAFAFDDVARTVTATDPLGHAWAASFDPDGNRTGLTDPYGKTWVTEYDLRGRVTAEADPLGNTTRYEYLVGGDRDRVAGPRSAPAAPVHTDTVYDRFGRPERVVDALGGETAYGYDRAGRVVSVTDPRGTRAAYGYDGLGRLRSAAEAEGLPEQRVTLYGYDAEGDLVSVTEADGRPERRVTAYGHDAAGRVTAATVAADKTGALTTGYGYDALDRVITVTAPGGRTTRYGHDALGRVTAVTEGSGSGLDRTTTYAYDAAGNLVTVTAPAPAAGQPAVATVYQYDALNRATKVTEASGTADQRHTSFAYDDAGRLEAVTDPLGKATAYAYDDAGRVKSVTDPLGQATAYAYDAAGNVVSVTDPRLHADTFGYDLLDRLEWSKDALLHQTAYEYDKAGNVTKVTDPRAHATAYAYDKLHRLVSVTDPLGKATTYAYDAFDHVKSVTDPRGAVTAYRYDALGRHEQTTDPLGNTSALGYDPRTGDLVRVTDPLGRETAYGYDALGRRVTARTPAGGTTTVSYDALDRVTKVTDPLDHATAYGYDALGRLTAATDPEDRVTGFGYDAAGRVTWVRDPNLNTTAFAYDDAGRLKSETDPLGKATAYAYDDAGNLASVTDRLGRVRAFGYDDADRKTSETWWASAGGAKVQEQLFGYDAAGNLTSATDPDGSYVLTYDEANRPVTVQEPFGLGLTFAYDAAGNRTSVADTAGGVAGGEQVSAYDPAGRLAGRALTVGGSAARAEYAYTPDGEVDAVLRFDATAPLTAPPAPVIAAGDFDGDGVTDLLWRDPITSAVVVWYLQDPARGAGPYPYLKREWSLGTVAWAPAVGDFDGTGTDDVLWHDPASGANHVWYLRDPAAAGAPNPAAPWARLVISLPANGWGVLSVGDFDADGASDLLWHDPASGANHVWYLRDPAAPNPPDPAAAWSDGSFVIASSAGAAVVGDFNRDGADDVLWRDAATAANTVWYLTRAGSNPPTVSPLAWWAVGAEWTPAAGDFDGDGGGDLLWHRSADGYNSIWYLRDPSAPNPPDPTAPWLRLVHDPAAAGGTPVAGDFNGDGTDDVLLHDAAGGVNHVMGLRDPSAPSPPDPSAPWSKWGTVVLFRLWEPHAADFDGDGTDDVLWHNAATGANLVLYHRDPATGSGDTPHYKRWLVLPPSGWELSVGDFDGDGASDLLWHDPASGANHVWHLRDPFAPNPPHRPAPWSNGSYVLPASTGVAHVGDFNGDGADDVLWRDAATAANTIWYLTRPGWVAPVVTPLALPQVSGEWSLTAGDFDGDGTADLLWHNGFTGANHVWYLNDPAAPVNPSYPWSKVSYVIASSGLTPTAGDFDGDGTADLLWRHAGGGAVTVWVMRDPAGSAANAVESVVAPWTIGPEWAAVVGDFDGSGPDDLLWRTPVRRSSGVWLTGRSGAWSVAAAPARDPAGFTDRSYDAGGRVAAVDHHGPTGWAGRATYGYDLAGRLTSQTVDGVTTAYAYDDAGQLTQAGADGFGYDPAGNRTGTGVQVGPANRVVNDGTWAYTYDDAGQVAGKQGAAGAWTYEYDHRGQLTGGTFAAFDGSPGAAVEYRYDALGNRVSRTQTVGGATTTQRFGYDGWDTARPDPVGGEGFDAWADVDAAGAVTMRRAFGAGFDDLVVRRDAAGAVGWYLGDRQGSVRRVVTGAGATVGAATYAGFGARTVTAGVVDRYGYAGREWDGVLGLQYGRARMYDPAAGRWTSEDPIGFAAGDPNLHRYVGNSPTNATDPSGLAWGDDWVDDNIWGPIGQLFVPPAPVAPPPKPTMGVVVRDGPKPPRPLTSTPFRDPPGGIPLGGLTPEQESYYYEGANEAFVAGAALITAPVWVPAAAGAVASGATWVGNTVVGAFTYPLATLEVVGTAVFGFGPRSFMPWGVSNYFRPIQFGTAGQPRLAPLNPMKPVTCLPPKVSGATPPGAVASSVPPGGGGLTPGNPLPPKVPSGGTGGPAAPSGAGGPAVAPGQPSGAKPAASGVAPGNGGLRVRERVDGSAVIEDANGNQVGPVYASHNEALANLNRPPVVPTAPTPPASRANRHWTPEEITEELRPGDIATHGIPSNWTFIGLKRVPLTQKGAPPDHQKVYEIWKDENGNLVEWHYELAPDGSTSIGKLCFPSTTELP